MEWIVFVELIFKLLDACMKRDGREAVAARLARGGFFVRATLRFLAKRAGFSVAERGAAVAFALDTLQEMKSADDGVDRFLDEVAETQAAWVSQ